MTEPTLSRRGVLAVAASAAVPVSGAPMWGATGTGRAALPQPGDVLVAADDPAHTPIRAAAIQPGAKPVLTWPMERQAGLVRDGARSNQTLLLRLPAGEGVPEGALVAFSAICQHAGCLISGWMAQQHLLLCPCHGSEYDPAHGGTVVTGPAPFPLPSLPLRVEDGVVVVAGHFSGRVGGHAGRTD